MHERHALDLGLEDPRGLGAAVRRDRRAQAPRGRPRAARQDQHGRVRDGLVDRALGLRPDPQPVGPRPHPRRLRRRLGRGRRRLRGARSRSAPTPAARSASPPPSPARSASSRPTAASAATAPSPWRRSLDQVGPVAAPCSTPALLHDVIGGHDPRDSTSLRDAWPSMADAARAGLADGALQGVRVGVDHASSPATASRPASRSASHEALALLESAGAEIVEVSAPSFEYAIAAYYLILPAEASSNLAKFDSVRFGLRVDARGRRHGRGRHGRHPRGRLRPRGQAPHHPRHLRASAPATTTPTTAARRRCARSSSATSPPRSSRSTCSSARAAPTTAFKLGEKLDDPMAMYLNDITTIPANLAGVPGMRLPIGLAPEDGLPVGHPVHGAGPRGRPALHRSAPRSSSCSSRSGAHACSARRPT